MLYYVTNNGRIYCENEHNKPETFLWLLNKQHVHYRVMLCGVSDTLKFHE